MAIGVFTDKDHQPRVDEISQALGEAKPLWEDLLTFIKDSYELEGEFLHYGKKYGWCRRYRKSGRALTTLFPAKGYFVAQIVLNPAQTKEALKSDLSATTQKLINNATPYHDGRLLWIEVKTKETLEDIKKLLLIKRKPVKR